MGGLTESQQILLRQVVTDHEGSGKTPRIATFTLSQTEDATQLFVLGYLKYHPPGAHPITVIPTAKGRQAVAVG